MGHVLKGVLTYKLDVEERTREDLHDTDFKKDFNFMQFYYFIHNQYIILGDS